jgi:uncharacterized protein (TIGR03435 family)
MRISTSKRSAWLLAAICVTLWAPAAHGQDKPARLTFDVASIRLTKPDTANGGIKALPGGHGYTAQNVPVKLMMALMYRVPIRQISGGPSWLESDRYDVEARVDGSYSLDDLHTMFQNLLVDRFGLKFHKEIKEGNIYALTIDPSGLKMKENDGPQDYNIPIIPGANGVQTGTRVPMPYLCWVLGQQLQRDERPVIDMTGLTKNYDFTLKFLPPLPPEVTKEDLPPEVRDYPSVFVALKEQLGLKLEAQKGPVEHYVIDSVERPSEN